MLIEHICRRPGGTTITFDTDARWPAGSYTFAPREEGGPHVAEVDEPAHVARFLEITDGFREVEPAGDSDTPKTLPEARKAYRAKAQKAADPTWKLADVLAELEKLTAA